MKKFTLFFFLLAIVPGFSQKISTPAGSFEILNNPFPEKKDFYMQSISRANLESYRLKTKRVTLEFRNGFQVELLSAKEMFLKGMKVDMNAYKEDADPKIPLPLFVVSDNGWLGAEIRTTSKSDSKQ